MRLGIDIDGVCANFGAAFNDWAERKTGVRVEVDQWEWFRGYPDGEALWREFWNGPAEGALHFAKPIPGAAKCLGLLAVAGCEIAYITHRNPQYHDVSRDWLRSHLFPNCYGVHHVEDDKSSVPCDIYLDDHVDNVQTLLRSGQQAYVFDQLYNRHAEFLPRVTDWPDFVRVVLEQVVAA